MDLDLEDIIAIYDHRWQIELLFKQLKQNFPLKYFYGESVNAIQSQIWVTLIANLLLTVVHRQIKRHWSFSNMVTMVRQMLVYYIDLYEFLENPEKYWLEVNKDTQNHLQNQHFLILFGKREDSLLQNKNKMPLFKDILIGFCPIFYFYRTAIISKLKLLPQTGTDYNCNTKKGRIKICIE